MSLELEVFNLNIETVMNTQSVQIILLVESTNNCFNKHCCKNLCQIVTPLCSVSGDSHRTVANLMLVGAAGYLLSFLPRHVFTPLLPSLESAQAALLADRCANTASETVFELVTLS